MGVTFLPLFHDQSTKTLKVNIVFQQNTPSRKQWRLQIQVKQWPNYLIKHDNQDTLPFHGNQFRIDGEIEKSMRLR